MYLEKENTSLVDGDSYPCIDSADSIFGNDWHENFVPAYIENSAKFDKAASPDSGAVWKVTTCEAISPPNRIRLVALISDTLRNGDLFLLRVMARATYTTHETGEARMAMTIQNHGGLFMRCAEASHSFNLHSRTVDIPFRVPRDCPANSVEIVLGFGFLPQEIEVQKVECWRIDPSFELHELPVTRMKYAGQGLHHEWRAAAAERIENFRKGEFKLELAGLDGKPFTAASINARLVSHDFEFGTCVPLSYITRDDDEARTYRKHLNEGFNACSPENELKWPRWSGEHPDSLSREETFCGLDKLLEMGFKLRGHVLVWPGWRRLPESILQLHKAGNDDAIPDLITKHIEDITTATRDYLVDWDVVNEPFNHHDLMDIFGNEVMVDWFRAAKRGAPKLPLFLNDWGNHDMDNDPDHVAHFLQTAKYLLANGAPLEGIGLQCHIGGIPCPPESLLKTLDYYREQLNLPIRITEFDMASDDEALQADYIRDFVTAAFSHPSVKGLQFWGFWEGCHWWPSAALYRSDWTIKPAGRAYLNLVNEQWNTNVKLTGNSHGASSFRGFSGTYEVEVKNNISGDTSTHRMVFNSDCPRQRIIV